jgi:hypothetical protein
MLGDNFEEDIIENLDEFNMDEINFDEIDII